MIPRILQILRVIQRILQIIFEGIDTPKINRIVIHTVRIDISEEWGKLLVRKGHLLIIRAAENLHQAAGSIDPVNQGPHTYTTSVLTVIIGETARSGIYDLLIPDSKRLI